MWQLLQVCHSEARIVSRLLYGNATLILYIFPVSVLSRLLSCPTSAAVSAGTLAKVAVHAAAFSLAFGYVFELANQTPAASVKEDRLNHPERPIPSGLLSVEGARVRWLVSWLLAPLATARLYGAPAAAYLIVWQVWVLIFYAWPRWRHWASKSLFNGVSALLALRIHDTILSHLVPGWSLHGPGADLAIAAWILCTIHIQDFCDIEGDRSAGRRTLPIVLDSSGRRVVRLSTAAFYVVAGYCAIACAQIRHGRIDSVAAVTGFIHAAASLILAGRTWRDNNKQMNKTTNCGYYYLAVFTLMVHLSRIFQT
ncbi:hypothetical protein HIM_05851 [Hirsutella minnesotensis 3608]|uniref:Uncharacterized protein n=1 Tax=Hirsutella minnesotensis 3608 TaxID=1043627 RepID=A0A0F8A554_9HYPO|nr:hypothetical protein HIM_05851 [Hirsutella minnesotensis 3608]